MNKATPSPSEDYNTTTFDVPDIPAWEGKLNPDAHIHYGLLSLQKMLAHDNPEVGFMQYAAAVRHIEGIARAAGRLDQEYEDHITQYREQHEGILGDSVDGTTAIDAFKLAQFKLELILKSCFSLLPIKTAGMV